MSAPEPGPSREHHPLYGAPASIENRRRLARAMFGTRAGRWLTLAALVGFLAWIASR
jgi:hypothetical protein